MFLKKKTFLYLITFVLVVITLLFVASYRPIPAADELSYGVTFSPRVIEHMGLNWQDAYTAMLDDLGVRKLRLAAYWDEVEYKRDVFNFDDVDWMLAEASKRDVEVILAVGGRLPRWPECHFPKWADDVPAGELLSYVERVVTRYRDNEHIAAWQVENEPFLTHFGECPRIPAAFLDREIALVRELDDRPVVVTDSGELSFWTRAMQRADIFGTTMYRRVYSAHLDRYITYPLSPAFFRLKYNLAYFFAIPKPARSIVIELQAEPWGPKPNWQLTKTEMRRTMDVDKFHGILEYARHAGFDEFYLWGVEWWWFMKEVYDEPGMWEAAQAVFND